MRLFAALAFLTRTPVGRGFDAEDVGRGSLFFPLVGGAVGLVLAGFAEFLRSHLPSLLVAVVVVALSAWISRGLHFDGLADFVDGLGGSADRDSALRIMRDPSIGAFGALALFFVVGLQVAAVEALVRGSPEVVYGAWILASSLSRWTSVPATYFLPNARSDGGVASALTNVVGWKEILGATVLSGAVVFLVDPWIGFAVWIVCIASSGIVFGLAKARIGGITGDVLGAAIVISETSALLTVVVATGASPC